MVELRGAIGRGGTMMRLANGEWIAFGALLVGLLVGGAAAQTVTREPDGVELKTANGVLRVRVVSAGVVRVSFAKSEGELPKSTPAIVAGPSGAVQWKLSETAGVATVDT